MLRVYYSDPPKTENGRKQYDITNYVISATWSGDISQAARKLEFSIAYNTADKDKSFNQLNLSIGGFICAAEVEENQKIEIFSGRIFFRKRTTDSFKYEFTCYDDLIYLAKSNIRANIKNVDAKTAIEQTCNTIGMPVSKNVPDMSTVVNFIADDKSGTEVIKMILGYVRADTGKEYNALCINGELTVVEKGEVIDDYIASNYTNVISSEHSESLEDMINRVIAVNEDGSVGQVYTEADDIELYGPLQKIYKMQPPKSGETVDNSKAAKALLKRVKEESSLKAIGNIQCISGYCIIVQEEQLKGKFFIKSDSHSFENHIHTMSLTLEYMPDEKEEINIKQNDQVENAFISSKEM